MVPDWAAAPATLRTLIWPDMRTLGLDFETYSSFDIKKTGSFNYMESPDFEILLCAYAFDDNPVTVIDLTAGEEFPQEFLNALWNPEVTKTAFNAEFERYAIWKHFGRYAPPEEWEDTMILAAQCGLPRSLAGVSEALKLDEDQAKMKEGKALIKYFCSPCKPTKVNGGRTRNLPEHAPEKWAKFKEYNGQDVVAERAIRNLLIRWKPLDIEHDFWVLDAKINERGIRIDTQMAENAVAMDTAYKQELTERAIALTGMENPKSVSQIKDWLMDQEDMEVPSLNKKAVADIVSQLKTDEAKQFMSIRAELSKTSTKKYEAMLRCTCPDGHAKGLFAFYGANRTGRFAGRHIQIQNLPANSMPDLDEAREIVKDGDLECLRFLYGNVPDTLSQLIRTALIPEEGHHFLVSDYSAIEARVLAWLADEQWRLDVFRNGGDIYCSSASQMFKVPVEKHGQNSHLRKKGKVAELACIAEGQLVLTDSGLVPIEQVTTDMKLWDGEEWVSHEGVVFKGIKEVITYEGLTATPDHLVWIEGKSEPVRFGDAASCGAHLLQMSRGQQPMEAKKLAQHKKVVRVFDVLNAGPRHRFTVSGVLTHNCGYGGGVNALKAFGADKMGMTNEEMIQTVDQWRAASPNVVNFWWDVDKAARRCIVQRKTTQTKNGMLRFEWDTGIMWMTLPSGRRLAYFGADYAASRWRKDKLAISYMGVNQKTRKWERIETYGPKLVENATQAMARDCLRDAMLALADAGFDIRATVHDEIICTEPIGGKPLSLMTEIMGRDLPWAPGLPLRGDGYTCTSYRKD